ncbi:Crp/Fnr family transcriptional regulator [Variovorax sp. PCZ-1]|uniref:Crp/Fnr family transcriptional regulator n=1 Tax=Variovorax sp. PCZ-1 TaxID=2835533 RepID=UPI001BCF70EF|nr:Crp/Fnr family transcriptional regulator [Variovorax sp. PCZ-1]MBS7806578.1 Crp/Fnr family transcriptional regulator [Variovorax sp. PCZ-1]
MNRTILPQGLKELLPTQLQQLADGALVRKGEHLFSIGAVPQWMFYVLSGEVSLGRSGAHGEHVIVQRCRQGFVSEASLMVQAYHCDAIALEETHVIRIPVKAMRDALFQDSGFANRWMLTLNAEIMRLRTQCERLCLHSVEERLVHLIQTEGHEGQYTIHTGIKTLAAQLGVSHEALYRTITDMRKLGKLDRTSEKLVLLPKAAA